jgi:hypothetical protein
MPVPTTKIDQQEIIADFIYEKHLELCMYIYLDAFINKHRAQHRQECTTYTRDIIWTLLDASYLRIRERLLGQGLLTEKAAGKYMMSLQR